MTAPAYSLDTWRRLQERKQNPPQPESVPAEIPRNAKMDEGLTLGFWNGMRYVSWVEWIWETCVSQVPVSAKSEADGSSCPLHWADCCTRVWIVKNGSRWLMFTGSARPESRRKDFASPYLNHAKRTAEHWYGPARDGWHAEDPPAKAHKEASHGV